MYIKGQTSSSDTPRWDSHLPRSLFKVQFRDQSNL